MTNPGAEKRCLRCGRRMEWRPRWARNWDQVRYCGEKCRRTRLDDTDRALESAILELLQARGGKKTICPSEAARRVAETWRPLMQRARNAARRLEASGRVEICQGGRAVDSSTAKGPIRIRSR